MVSLQQALSSAADSVDAGRLDEAEQQTRRLLAQHPLNPAALHLLGVIAHRRGKYHEAADLLASAIRAGAALAPVYFELGLVLHFDGRSVEAVEPLQRAVELDPQFQSAFVNLGAVLEKLDRPSESIACYRRAAELEPDCASTQYNLANALWAIGEVDDACRHFTEATRLAPDMARAHWNSACCHLVAGQFEIGWREYEWRDRCGEVAIDRYPQPRWRGEPLAGKCILVHGEQGIGDEILFASCLPELIAQAGHCIVICDPRLQTLLARSFPGASVLGYPRRKDLAPVTIQTKTPIDFQVPAGSVPQFLRRSQGNFPKRKRFLLADPTARKAWRTRYEKLGPGLTIGISWRAGGQPAERRKRTTSLEQWMPILSTPGVHFVNLQYGETSDELDHARRQLGVTIHDWPEADPLVDLDGFAAKVAALDKVISVGNATVHMAGALGVPAWNILPKVPAWRWMIRGDESLWYPSVKLFRQSERGEWAPVFAHVAMRLQELVLQLPGMKQSPAGQQYVGQVQPLVMQPRAQETPLSVIAMAGMPEVALSDSCSTRDLTTQARQDKTTASKAAAKPAPEEPLKLDRLSDVDNLLDAASQSYRAGDLPRAEALCREILQHAPRSTNALHLLGVMARQTRRLDLAIRSLSHAISVWDQDPAIHFNLASALHDAGQWDKAIESYQKAIALKPDFIDALLSLGGALLAARRTDEAIESYQEILQQQPNHAKAHNALGCAYLQMQRYPQAEQALRQAIKHKPNYPGAYNNLGQALEHQDRWEEAIRAYQTALEQEEKLLPAITNLAGALMHEKQLETAARLYERALKIAPKHTTAWAHLGEICESQQRLADARQCYRCALENSSNSTSAQAGLLRVESALGLSHDSTVKR